MVGGVLSPRPSPTQLPGPLVVPGGQRCPTARVSLPAWPGTRAQLWAAGCGGPAPPFCCVKPHCCARGPCRGTAHAGAEGPAPPRQREVTPASKQLRILGTPCLPFPLFPFFYRVCDGLAGPTTPCSSVRGPALGPCQTSGFQAAEPLTPSRARPHGLAVAHLVASGRASPLCAPFSTSRGTAVASLSPQMQSEQRGQCQQQSQAPPLRPRVSADPPRGMGARHSCGREALGSPHRSEESR